MSEDELVAAYWTTSGPTRYGVQECSPIGWPERCEVAAGAGFAGIVLLDPADPRRPEAQGRVDFLLEAAAALSAHRVKVVGVNAECGLERLTEVSTSAHPGVQL